jgi:hypothetical protein
MLMTEQNNHSFLDWIAGFLTEDDTNQSLEDIEIEKVIGDLNTICHEDESGSFYTAAMAATVLESLQKPLRSQAETVEQPSTAIPLANGQPSASSGKVEQPLVPVPIRRSRVSMGTPSTIWLQQ